MDLLREKARCLGHHRAQFGGDSSSTSSQRTDYNYSDSRSVSSSDSHNQSDSSSRAYANSGNTSTTIKTTDAGAVAAGSQVSLAALKQNSTNTQALFALADKLFSGTGQAMEANMALTRNLSQGAQQAYSDATAQATGNKTVIVAGLVVVGAVAFVAFGKN